MSLSLEKTKMPRKNNWKQNIYSIIYDADTFYGKLFDVLLFILILFSIVIVMLESVKSISENFGQTLFILEFIITALFSAEYIFRIISNPKPKRYIFSVYGIIDLLSTLPMYISIFFVGSHMLLTIRVFRLLRVFRVLKLFRFMGEASNLQKAIFASRVKIMVFIYSVLLLSVLLGTIMYLIEGEENGFINIPKSIYWTIVTLTTVGYGDIAPQTPLGQLVATFIMILGYGVIAVPTGIVTTEISKMKYAPKCKNCKASYNPKSKFCSECGLALS